MARLFTFILETTTIKFMKYLLILVDIIKKHGLNYGKCKNIKKSGNKMVKILSKLKGQILPDFKSKNLFSFKKV